MNWITVAVIICLTCVAVATDMLQTLDHGGCSVSRKVRRWILVLSPLWVALGILLVIGLILERVQEKTTSFFTDR